MRKSLKTFLSIGFLAIVAMLTTSCLAQNKPALLANPTVIETNQVISSPLPKGDDIQLFNLENKKAEDVIQDYKLNKKEYNNFKKPTPDTKPTDQFTEKDNLLSSLSAGMGEAWIGFQAIMNQTMPITRNISSLPFYDITTQNTFTTVL